MVSAQVFDADPALPDAELDDPDASPNQPDAQALPDADPASPDAGGCDQGPTIDFADDFDDDTFDTRWNVSTTGTGTAMEIGGQVELALP